MNHPVMIKLLPSLTSTQRVFFDKVHVKQVCGPPSTSPSNYKICLCESVGKLKGIGKQGKVKINNINSHTFKRSREILRLLSRTTGKRKIPIIRDMERDEWIN